jgi:hypothetical protein
MVVWSQGKAWSLLPPSFIGGPYRFLTASWVVGPLGVCMTENTLAGAIQEGWFCLILQQDR